MYHCFGVEPHAMFFALQADWRKQHEHATKDRHYLSALGLPVAATPGNTLDAIFTFLLCLQSARRMWPWWWRRRYGGYGRGGGDGARTQGEHGCGGGAGRWWKTPRRTTLTCCPPLWCPLSGRPWSRTPLWSPWSQRPWLQCFRGVFRGGILCSGVHGRFFLCRRAVAPSRRRAILRPNTTVVLFTAVVVGTIYT